MNQKMNKNSRFKRKSMYLVIMVFLITGSLTSYSGEKMWYDKKEQTTIRSDFNMGFYTRHWSRERIPCGKDPASGADIIQLTSGPATSTNVYPEQRFTSADGTRIIITRTPFSEQHEIWMCDLKKKQTLLRIGPGIPITASYENNAIYYIVREDAEVKLMRLDIKELTACEAFRFPLNECPRKFAVSADERWLVCGPFKKGKDLYELKRIDLEKGKIDVLCEMKYISNPHLQCDPGNPDNVLVQINRKGYFGSPGEAFYGPIGATLAVVKINSGKILNLPVGKPHTNMISGHEAWIGTTGSLLFSTAPGGAGDLIKYKGVYKITPGDKNPIHLAQGLPFNHIGISNDGRYFIVDDYKTWRIYVGSVKTGRYLELCDSKTRQGAPQYTHAHPYMTPDNKYVIYNSVATGLAQVYAARIPEGYLEKLDSLEAIKHRE